MSRGENEENKWRPKQVATSLALETGEGVQAGGVGRWAQGHRSSFKTVEIGETNIPSEKMSK